MAVLPAVDMMQKNTVTGNDVDILNEGGTLDRQVQPRRLGEGRRVATPTSDI